MLLIIKKIPINQLSFVSRKLGNEKSFEKLEIIAKNIYYCCKTLKLEQHNLPNEQLVI